MTQHCFLITSVYTNVLTRSLPNCSTGGWVWQAHIGQLVWWCVAKAWPEWRCSKQLQHGYERSSSKPLPSSRSWNATSAYGPFHGFWSIPTVLKCPDGDDAATASTVNATTTTTNDGRCSYECKSLWKSVWRACGPVSLRCSSGRHTTANSWPIGSTSTASCKLQSFWKPRANLKEMGACLIFCLHWCYVG